MKYYIKIVSEACFQYLVNGEKKDNQCLFALYSGVKPVFLNALVMHLCRNIQSFF